MKQQSKYYVPDITEFHVGFEFEIEDHAHWRKGDFHELDLYKRFDDYYLRVKYLDKEDIESLGFNDGSSYKLDNHIKPKYSFFKITDNDIIYVIQVYWDMLRDERENLVRIFKGKLHKYPYTEIFRGDIKNKSELKKLLKQLNIT